MLLDNLLTNVILGQDFLKQHEQVPFNFGGLKPILNIGALECIKTSIVSRLFEYLLNDCASATDNALYRIHADLCHPGITRMFHYVHVKDLPYLLKEIKQMIAGCSVCCKIKPRFYKPPQGTLKAFKRLRD